jgi:hypothetical protein
MGYLRKYGKVVERNSEALYGLKTKVWNREHMPSD